MALISEIGGEPVARNSERGKWELRCVCVYVCGREGEERLPPQEKWGKKTSRKKGKKTSTGGGGGSQLPTTYARATNVVRAENTHLIYNL